MYLRSVAPVALAIAAAFSMLGCREAACTLVGGESGVFVDATELGGPRVEGGEVCLDATCLPMGWSEHLRGQNATSYTSFKVDDETDEELTIVVRDAGGNVVAGPTEVSLQDTYPNGKSCPPKLRTASVVVTLDGQIETRQP